MFNCPANFDLVFVAKELLFSNRMDDERSRKGNPRPPFIGSRGCEVDIYWVRVKSGQKNTSKAEKED